LVDEQAHKIEKINLSIDFILGHQFLKGASGDDKELHKNRFQEPDKA